jgi:hypothetical protein
MESVTRHSVRLRMTTCRRVCGAWERDPGDHFAGLIAELPNGASPAAVARALTETALTRGGRDNITVVVIDFDPTRWSAP